MSTFLENEIVAKSFGRGSFCGAGLNTGYLYKRMSFFSAWKDLVRGKSLTRNLFNEALAGTGIWRGQILDVGGTNIPIPSYRSYLKIDDGASVKTVNLDMDAKPDYLCDAARLPIADASIDGIWCLNLLEHVPEPAEVLRECRRVLRPDGRIVVVTPFLVRIHAHPYDFHRFTPMQLEKMLERTGFDKVNSRGLGGGPWQAGLSQIQGAVPMIFTALLYPICAILDMVILQFRPTWRQMWPLAIIASAKASESTLAKVEASGSSVRGI